MQFDDKSLGKQIH